jgi:hypothetical protein
MSKPTLRNDEIKLEVLRLHNEGLPSRMIAAITGVSKSSVNYFLGKVTHADFWEDFDKKPVISGELDSPEKKRRRLTHNRFVITSAQNNSYVFRKAFQSLTTYCTYNDAQLIVGTYTYNKNGFQNLNKESDDIWFDPYLEPYILNESCELADGLVYNGELNILPTAVNPLSGLQGYNKGDSGIVPHAKLRMESIPRHKFTEPTFLYTTGTITQRNYIQQKAGQKAAFHHVYSALVVEVDTDGDWFVRQLVFDKDGCFYDLDVFYTPDKSPEESQRVEAITYGDLHAEQADMEACAASFISPVNSMLTLLKPKYQFVHDTIDFNARNHHNIDNPYHRFRVWKDGKDTVEYSIEMAGQALSTMVDNAEPDCRVVVVESNHDQALGRWLRDTDYRKDPPNAVYYLKLQYQNYRSMDEGRPFHLFEYAVRDKLEDAEGDKIVFLKEDDSFEICGPDGIENGYHGHRGINGSRGSTQQFRKLNTRMSKGHSHTAEIVDGVYSAGTLSKMDLGYNVGGTTWSHSNIVTYPNGKRAIVTIKNGKWMS